MKILFLAHRTPFPPDKGDKIRSFHLLSHLARRHRVSLAYWVDDPKDMSHATALGRICRGKIVPVVLDPLRANVRALVSLARGKSFTEGYYYSRRFQAAVDALVKHEQPDLVYVFSSAMARYVEGMQTLPRIVDFVDVDSDKWRQLSEYAGFPLTLLYRLERKRLAQFEIQTSTWARHSLFVSDVEADLFRALGGQGAVVALPNGVECSERQVSVDDDIPPEIGRREHKPSRPIKLLFVGTMNYFPNSDAVLYFAREILPKIRDRFPEVVFDIVGRCPPRSVLGLNADGIRVHGEVKDIHPFLAEADVSVAPLRVARGVQNKVLEAMAVGVPVVATSEAVKGIRVCDGRDILLADTPELFADQVTRLLSDRELRASLAKRARQRVQEIYNWRIIGARLDDLIQDPQCEISRGVA